MPLQIGKSWTYKVRTPTLDYVEVLRVSRQVPVANSTGYELNGPFGPVRMAWSNGKLLLDRLAEFRFQPGIVLLGARNKATELESVAAVWRGRTFLTGYSRTQFSTELKTTGRTWNSMCSKISIKLGSKSYVLTTWFVDGVGIVRQEQSEGNLPLVRIDLLSES